MNVLISGNNITLTGLSELDVLVQIQNRNLIQRQFSGLGQEDGTVNLTFPMTSFEHFEFAGQIHRYNAEQRKKNPNLESKGPKGTEPPPPTGGTPSAAKTAEFKETIAIAA